MKKVLIIVAFLVLLSVIAYLVLSKKSQPVATQPAAQNALQPTATNQPAVVTESPSVAGPAEFNIPQFGVKIVLPDNIKDLKYSSSNSGNPTVSFSTVSLEAAGNKFNTGAYKPTDCNAGKAPLGFLIQFNPGDQAPMNPPGTTIEQVSIAKKVGNHYYIYQPPQAPCSSNSEVESLHASQKTSLQQAINSSLAVN